MSRAILVNGPIPVKIKKLTSAQAYYEEGNRLGCYNNLVGALECFKLATVLKPDFDDAHAKKAGMLRSLGNPEEAIEAAKDALNINPKNLWALYNLWRATDPDRENPASEAAMKSIKDAIAKTPNDYKAQAFVNVLEDRSDLETEIYKQASIKFPKDQFIHQVLGFALKEAGSFAEAEIAYKTAATLDKDFVAAWIGWGDVLELQKKYPEAEIVYTTYILCQ